MTVMLDHMSDRNPSAAPGELELVRQFVNTLDLEQGTDVLDEDWLAANELGNPSPTDELKNLREALRSALLANHDGAEVPADDLAVLNAAAQQAGLRIGFLPTGDWRAETDHADAGGVLLARVVAAMAGGTWTRLKVCLNDECRWAFYDHSNSRGSKWCDMRICGNRVKQRAHRARARGN